MKREDHIDEKYIPTEEDFAPEQVNEKEQLLKSIRKGCRFYIVFYSILAITFALEGFIKLDDVSDSKLYLCPLIALMLVFALVMVFYSSVVPRQPARCSTSLSCLVPTPFSPS